MKKKLFIFGLGSLTGSKLAKLAATKYEIIGTHNTRIEKNNFFDSIQLNVCNHQKVKDVLIEKNPDFVVNSAALNNVDYCEKNPILAKEVNHIAVENISKICDDVGIKLIQLSTDSVFDGQQTLSYVETDKVNPVNVYGQTKHASELHVLKNSNNLVIRASVLYGWLCDELSSQSTSSMKQFNFGLWLIRALNKNETIQVITDELSSPIVADDFARSILHLISKNYSGVFHAAPKVNISRYDFSKKFAKVLELNHELIKPITNKELCRNVKTSLNKCLNSEKLTSTGFNFLNLDDSFKLIKNQINS
jgi:dTDP-4-dehydrorhamnose reductase